MDTTEMTLVRSGRLNGREAKLFRQPNGRLKLRCAGEGKAYEVNAVAQAWLDQNNPPTFAEVQTQDQAIPCGGTTCLGCVPLVLCGIVPPDEYERKGCRVEIDPA